MNSFRGFHYLHVGIFPVLARRVIRMLSCRGQYWTAGAKEASDWTKHKMTKEGCFLHPSTPGVISSGNWISMSPQLFSWNTDFSSFGCEAGSCFILLWLLFSDSRSGFLIHFVPFFFALGDLDRDFTPELMAGSHHACCCHTPALWYFQKLFAAVLINICLSCLVFASFELSLWGFVVTNRC